MNRQRLDAAIAAACPIRGGLSIGKNNDKATWHFIPDDPAQQPTPTQATAIAAAIAAYDMTPTAEEKLDDLGGRLQFALAVRLSTNWLLLPVGKQAKIQDIIDKAAAKAAAML